MVTLTLWVTGSNVYLLKASLSAWAFWAVRVFEKDDSASARAWSAELRAGASRCAYGSVPYRRGRWWLRLPIGTCMSRLHQVQRYWSQSSQCRSL